MLQTNRGTIFVLGRSIIVDYFTKGSYMPCSKPTNTGIDHYFKNKAWHVKSNI